MINPDTRSELEAVQSLCIAAYARRVRATQSFDALRTLVDSAFGEGTYYALAMAHIERKLREEREPSLFTLKGAKP